MKTRIIRYEILEFASRRSLPLYLSLLLSLGFLAACSTGSVDPNQTASDRNNASTASKPDEQAEPTATDHEQEFTNETDQLLSAPIAGIDPCQLLTPSELEAAFAEPLGKIEGETIFTYTSCSFESQSGGKFIILQVTEQNAEQFRRDNEETSAMFEAALIPVTDLGDEAVFYSGLLRVRIGETVLQVATWYTDAEQDQALAMTRELAGFALERLP